MSGHSRRKNSWLGIQESQERLSFKNDLPDMGYSPLKSYRAEQYGNSSENVTPRKNVRNYTDK